MRIVKLHMKMSILNQE